MEQPRTDQREQVPPPKIERYSEIEIEPVDVEQIERRAERQKTNDEKAVDLIRKQLNTMNDPNNDRAIHVTQADKDAQIKKENAEPKSLWEWVKLWFKRMVDPRYKKQKLPMTIHRSYDGVTEYHDGTHMTADGKITQPVNKKQS